jgi:hypothetical protein
MGSTSGGLVHVMRERSKFINIRVKVHPPTGMLAAFSDELQGLLVIGANAQEIEAKLPGAIGELMDAMGSPVTHVELMPVHESDTEWVSETKFRAELARAA